VSAVLIVGEIIPQAICARWSLQIGSMLAPLVWVMIAITFPLSYPLSKLLDFILGVDQTNYYRRVQLMELIAMHGEQLPDEDVGGSVDGRTPSDHPPQKKKNNEEGVLEINEVKIINSVLQMRNKKVGAIMTKIEDTFMVAWETNINRFLMKDIVDMGHSRLPVYMSNDRSNIVGMLLVKNLVLLDPDESTPVSTLTVRRMPQVPESKELFELLSIFQSGKTHMAVVLSAADCATVVGVVTLEDVIEELLATEIYDEMDHERSSQKARKVNAQQLQKMNEVFVRSRSPHPSPSSPVASTSQTGSTAISIQHGTSSRSFSVPS